jgi:hypothetical protein
MRPARLTRPKPFKSFNVSEVPTNFVNQTEPTDAILFQWVTNDPAPILGHFE